MAAREPPKRFRSIRTGGQWQQLTRSGRPREDFSHQPRLVGVIRRAGQPVSRRLQMSDDREKLSLSDELDNDDDVEAHALGGDSEMFGNEDRNALGGDSEKL